jgi:hypothetical protein
MKPGAGSWARVVVLAGPEAIDRWFSARPEGRGRAETELGAIRLIPWQRGAVERAVEELELSVLNVDELIRRTGGYHALVRSALAGREPDPPAGTLIGGLGLADRPELVETLRALAEVMGGPDRAEDEAACVELAAQKLGRPAEVVREQVLRLLYRGAVVRGAELSGRRTIFIPAVVWEAAHP